MKIRIALAQVNPTVGDFNGNVRDVLRMTAEAKRRGAQIVAFPELVLCGYPPEDLLLKPGFLADSRRALRTVARDTRGIVALVGAPEPPSGKGRPYNACHVISGGKVAATYRKINLPNYGVFDEKRYFEQGENALVVSFGDLSVGTSICEDVWVDDGPTAAQALLGGARIIINISASPYHRRKGREREKLMQRRARENGCWLCYLNLVGGQDELVFDGCSVIASPDGATIARGKAFEEDLIIADIDPSEARPATAKLPSPFTGAHKRVEIVDLPPLAPGKRNRPVRPRRARHLDAVEEVYRALVLGTRDYVNKNGFSKVVLGMSGGVDSALVAAVAADALGADRVTGVTMPSEVTSKATLRDARAVCDRLGIEMLEIPIADIYESYIESTAAAFRGRRPDVTEENFQARIRGNLLMALSNKFGWLVLTTGNKSELAVGYCTLYGDMAGGFAVIKDVPKTLVYPLCRYRNARARKPVIPGSILRRRPTAELRTGQFDQDTLPPYPVLDRIIELYVEHDLGFDEIVERGLDRALVKKTIHMIDTSEYKRRQGAPGIKITPKAFGRDRRLPITNRYRGAGGNDRPRGPQVPATSRPRRTSTPSDRSGPRTSPASSPSSNRSTTIFATSSISTSSTRTSWTSSRRTRTRAEPSGCSRPAARSRAASASCRARETPASSSGSISERRTGGAAGARGCWVRRAAGQSRRDSEEWFCGPTSSSKPAHRLYVKSGFRPARETRAIDPTNPTSVERFFELDL